MSNHRDVRPSPDIHPRGEAKGVRGNEPYRLAEMSHYDLRSRRRSPPPMRTVAAIAHLRTRAYTSIPTRVSRKIGFNDNRCCSFCRHTIYRVPFFNRIRLGGGGGGGVSLRFFFILTWIRLMAGGHPKVVCIISDVTECDVIIDTNIIRIPSDLLRGFVWGGMTVREAKRK